MTPLKTIFTLALLAPAAAFAASPIVCENQNPNSSGASIWPSLYMQDSNTLCFDVKGWPEFSGTNCVKNGKTAKWTGLVIVWEGSESFGRDSTNFRVVNPVVTDEQINYRIEWSRGEEWRTMQDVSINRLTGGAVSYYIGEHGGESYQCRTTQKAI